MCERFYREHSRAGGVGTAWPSQQSRRADLKLRAMLEVYHASTPSTNPNHDPSPSPSPSPSPNPSPNLYPNPHPNQVPFSSGAKIREAAADRLGIALDGPPEAWGWAAEPPFGIEPRRPRMAVISHSSNPNPSPLTPHPPHPSPLTPHPNPYQVIFLIDRTFEGFLQNVVDAVLKP